ncbi:MAG TPA: HIT family protein [Aestuariivirgaceae bacterium]|jgi:diadenosine tetraphosphate (Ap4A) HIT family hydrolase
MTNETMRKFGYPGTLVRDYEHWSVLLRPAQVTLGALVLAAKSDAQSLAALSTEAFAGLARVTRDIDAAFRDFPAAEKINYLMLMMVDPHVHFHVLPRYSASRQFDDIAFEDRGWPGPPDLKAAPPITAELFARLLHRIKSHWPQA